MLIGFCILTANEDRPESLVTMFPYMELNVTQGQQIVTFLNSLVRHPEYMGWSGVMFDRLCHLLAVYLNFYMKM